MPTLTTADDAARLLAQAHERLGEQGRLVESDPGRWYALFNDGQGYQIEWSDTWGRLVFVAVLGYPPSRRERQVLNLALSYNTLWRRVGNLRMAREGDGGELMLIGELGPDEVEPSALDAALLHFEGLRRWWSETLIHEGDEVPLAPPLSPWMAGRA